MFGWLKKIVQDVRIDLDFRKFDRKCRREFESYARSRYSPDSLKAERRKLVSKIDTEAAEEFDEKIRKIRENHKLAQVSAEDIRYSLSFFTRFYKQELEELYAEKKSLLDRKSELISAVKKINCELREAHVRKNEAYEELNHYKGKVNSWHAESKRSPWLFGNSGKKIPKHSLFGQSFGDLESYKSSRDSAYDDVQEEKETIDSLFRKKRKIGAEIDRLKNRVGDISTEIDRTKTSRSTMYELKKAGHTRQKLQRTLQEIEGQIETHWSDLQVLENQKSEYVIAERHRSGVVELDAKIGEVIEKQNKLISSFDLDENVQKRKDAHRDAWLKGNGIA